MGSGLGKLRRGTRRWLVARQDGLCTWCKLPLPGDLVGAELDHIIPRSRGGPGDIWNRQVLHKHCNRGPGGKWSKLTPEAEALAAEHGIVLHDPLPTAKVTIRRIYEVECHTCHCIIDAPDSREKAVEAKRDHIATHDASRPDNPAA